MVLFLGFPSPSDTTRWRSRSEKNYPIFIKFLSFVIHCKNVMLCRKRYSPADLLSIFSIDYSRCSFMSISILFYFVIYMFIPRKECLFTLVITRYPKCNIKEIISLSINFGFTCNALLSLTYQTMVHCLPYIIFLTTQ